MNININFINKEMLIIKNYKHPDRHFGPDQKNILGINGGDGKQYTINMNNVLYIKSYAADDWKQYPENKPTDIEPMQYLVVHNNGMQSQSVMLWVPKEQAFYWDPLDKIYLEDELIAFMPLEVYS